MLRLSGESLNSAWRQRSNAAREIRGDLGRDALHRWQRRFRVGAGGRRARRGAGHEKRSAERQDVHSHDCIPFSFVGTNMRKPFCRRRADAMTNLFMDLQGSVNAKDRQRKGP
jgi:hypothetical protein